MWYLVEQSAYPLSSIQYIPHYMPLAARKVIELFKDVPLPTQYRMSPLISPEWASIFHLLLNNRITSWPSPKLQEWQQRSIVDLTPKRWWLGIHQGAIRPSHLDYYLDEFTFRFNRRTSKARGLLFYRLMEQAVDCPPVPRKMLIGGKSQHVVSGWAKCIPTIINPIHPPLYALGSQESYWII